jgi:hypothetical protein
MSDPAITARQLEILRHALGISQSGYEYRNYYVPEGNEVAECEALEKMGLMSSFHREWLPSMVYQCTAEGRRIARQQTGGQHEP